MKIILQTFFIIATAHQLYASICEDIQPVVLYFNENAKIVEKYAFVRFVERRNASDYISKLPKRIESLESTINQQMNIMMNLVSQNTDFENHIKQQTKEVDEQRKQILSLGILTREQAIPTGTIAVYSGIRPVPVNWLLCDGKAVSRTI